MTNIKIQGIVDGGVANNERLILQATGIDNIGLYVVFLTRETTPGRISSTPKNSYWFPDQNVKDGDKIVLYTKSGVSSQRANPNGSTTFFYYWGLSSTVFNNSSDTAALLKIEQWEYKTKGS
ncbi:hypothetical protein A2130_00225 [Candidatus Woesebacteria bacterium GWC2_33_12]|uniref:Uncharacterized protein n=1 Tax=Candidatus Woesebacteria bacterium GW2011_GWB1_33_22 TaxID=1618566 RepID=A0A0F9ZL36_9BACT|nr:MAG: hypothetical protein UR29_C0010G0036 [Candidatus Woesebacteria bacterium GW2011_GWC2_33_12]KKP42061.1 MAG: hypothetical protein UR33_C0006G0045 [Candidatus Woesebacteria bacterium GW2011_GWA2_33_20]KKP44789.1 MAG: hypothetical protein UR35_C0006G0024 [Candidatus Woesebacteria bacterium GW2011_GWB1_33_22]KKP46608.1 MAG: hypothetical protein UR37_C0006G0058 [Microgenomates group bacterium GW2011_GWC1_33_28]KKP50521.1 MAG: hypothetical protein UR41_C0006G0024 [Candidatus Woesebacteria bact